MGIFTKLFKQSNVKAASSMNQNMETLNFRMPFFREHSGSIYELDLTRSIIHTKAKHTAKLSPHVAGDLLNSLESTLQFRPNHFMSTYDFLYRARTLFEVDTYVFIIPIMDEDQLAVVGFYPLMAQNVEFLEYKGEMWLRYTFESGQKAAIEYNRVGVLSKMNYKNEFIGDGNNVIRDSINLIKLQNEGMQDAIKETARIDFLARISGTMRPEDIEEQRKNFSKFNLSSENKSRTMMFDQKIVEVKQIEYKPYVPDEKQMNFIKGKMYSYFGISEDILQNKYDENTWNAFYEGEIEPFAIQLSQAMTNMLFTIEEIKKGSKIHFSANRLQYASNATKLEVSKTLFDRGIFGTHDIADIWNMPKVGENTFYIRKEYAEMDELDDNVTSVKLDGESNEEKGDENDDK